MDKTTNSSSSSERNNERGQWNRKVEYLLSLIGYTVGLGNLWRFPYICMRNGGGAFLIPFVFFLVFCGLPLFFLETAIGQFSGKGILHVWDVCPLFKGVGYGMAIPLFVINIYYNMIIAWTLYYIGNSFITPLPWTVCDNDWNSLHCVKDSGSLNNHTKLLTKMSNQTILNETSSWITAQEDFWQQNVLQMSSGVGELGQINWRILLALFGAWMIVGLCIIKGVKSVGKVVYVTALLPYVILTIILIRGLTLDGSVDGVIMFLRPDFSHLLKLQVWLEAALQVFYSLGPGWGPLISMASFNKFDNNILRDSIMLTFIGEGTSIHSGLVIFTVLGFMAAKLSLPIDQIVKSGPGLGFIAYPEALANLPGQNVWSCLFFVMLLTVGLDSQFAVCESIVVVFTDSFQSLRRRRILFTIAFCAFSFLLGIIFCTQGGIYIFQLVDWYVAAFSLPIFGFIECIIFGWIYGADRFSNDVYLMIGRKVPAFFRICIGFITPIILLGLIVSSFVAYRPPTYGSYTYPESAVAFGTIISVTPIVPIFVFAFIAVKNAEGQSIKEKIKSSLRPSTTWKPVCHEYQEEYLYTEDSKNSVLDNLKLNLIGSKH
ncbi:sodium- and chloride-dependent glycine transporter 1-like [Mytilus trossulus]|uniref:sodium- and chloride-dependent glycine transporter 1-like n=1 Tax=Mytilus trossulus TaxID=6551 RepID=UPI003005118A